MAAGWLVAICSMASERAEDGIESQRTRAIKHAKIRGPSSQPIFNNMASTVIRG